MIKASLCTTMMLLLGTTLATAQHGRAPYGFYTAGYQGDIFRGTVTSTDDVSDSITLESLAGKKEFFTGRLERPCAVTTKNGKAMRPSDIPPGTGLTLFYDRKPTYQKTEENLIFAMTFNTWEGKPVPELKRRLYPCTARAMRTEFGRSESGE